jgi:uncharacterized protein (TIGR03437 family)
MNVFLMRVALTAALGALCALAQSTESIPFRVNMSPLNEVPAIENLNASGFATVWVHVVRNSAGRVVSGTVDFTTRYQFPTGITFTGFHIHRGAVGTNGPVLIDTRISGGNPVVDETGRGQISRSVQILEGTANVAVLEELIANPEGFYINLHTTNHPGGALRAQMTKAERRVLGALLSPTNEVPAAASNASGLGFVTILAGLNSRRELVSAEVTFEVNYTGFAEGTQFTGMHIHNGNNGVNGPVTIDTGLNRAQNILAGSGGTGSLKYVVDANLSAPATVSTILNIWSDPGTAYLNIHTVANAGGEIRSQLRGTERLTFQTPAMSPTNEVPAITNLSASAVGQFEVNVLRRADGNINAALGIFSVNHRFPGSTTFTGLHIHTGAEGANGPVSLDSGIRAGSTVVSDTGFGNIYRTAIFSTEAQLTALNGMVANPEGYYLNLHTTDNPGGAVRQQTAARNTAKPTIEAVISAVSDVNLRRVAPGGLFTVLGSNLAKVPGSLDGWQSDRVPPSLNGTSVDIGGRPAAILNVDPRFVLAQVPTDVLAGDVDVVVRAANGASSPVRVTVANAAPAVFFDQITSAGNRAVAYAVADGAQITADAPAAGGSMVAVFTTGLGLATPAQMTGEVVRMVERYSDVKVTVGGRDASGVSATLIPGYVGFSQTVFMVPSGLSGGQALELEYQGVRSNRTLLFVR